MSQFGFNELGSTVEISGGVGGGSTVFADKAAQNAGFSALPNGSLFYRTDLAEIGYKLNGSPVFRSSLKSLRDFESSAGALGIVEFQAAVDWCFTNNKTLLIPNGTYTLSDTLKLGYGATIGQIHIMGERNVILNFTPADRPAINFQGIVTGSISNIQLVGSNNVSGNIGSVLVQPNVDRAVYVQGISSNTQRSPYSGISIGAYTGATPSGPYSNDPYGRLYCSNITITNCDIKNFVIGVMVDPSGGSTLNNEITVDNTVIQYCAVGIGIGNSSNTGVTVRDSEIKAVHTVIDTAAYGNGTGHPPTFQDCSIEGCYQVLSLQSGVGPCRFSDSVFTSTLKIGNCGMNNAVNPYPVSFVGCDIGIDQQSFQYRPITTIETNGPVYMESSTLRLTGSSTSGVVNAGYGARGSIQLDSSTIQFDDEYLGEPLIFRRPAGQERLEGYGSQWVTGDNNGPIGSNVLNITPTNRFGVDQHTRTVWVQNQSGILDSGSREVTVPYPNSVTVAFSSPVWSTTTLQFIASDASLLMTGDWIWCSTTAIPGLGSTMLPLARVTSITGSLVVCTLVASTSQYDQISTTLSIIPRAWGYSGAVRMITVTNGSTTVQSATNPTEVLKVGDWIRGYCFADNTRVAGLTSNTILVTKSPISSGTIALQDAVIARPQLTNPPVTIASTGSITTIDCIRSLYHNITITSDTSIQFGFNPYQGLTTLTITFVKGGTGSYTVTWPTMCQWHENLSPPMMPWTAGQILVVEAVVDPSSNRIMCRPVFQNYSRQTANTSAVLQPNYRYLVPISDADISLILPQTHKAGDKIGVKLTTVLGDHTLTIVPYGTQKIDDQTNIQFSVDYEWIVLESVGTGWIQIE